jgi:thiol-disulfide isomerase/thioredoxin
LPAQARRTVYREPDAVQKEKLAEQFKRDFPTEKFHSIDNSVAYSFAKEKNTAKAKQYLSAVKDPAYRPDAVYKVVKEIMKYDLSAAEDLAGTELAGSKALIADTSLTKELRKNHRYNPMDGYQIMLKLYTDVLIKKENYSDALKYYEEYRKNDINKGTYLDKRHTLLLSKNKRYKEAFVDLEKLAATGKADDQMKGELRKAFTALNPGKNVDEYMAPLSLNLKEKYAEEAIKSVIREKSPNFTVTDVNGKNVSLQDYKGKTIVLDFWATWCGPCKASLPAMQKLVNKYKNNPDVKFLFIHTMEHTPSPKQEAIAYLKNNSYNLDLFMDLKDAKIKANPAAAAFKVVAIPAKFVIDGQGDIRFKLTGFYGGDDAAVAEVSAMVDLVSKVQ